MNGRVTGLKKSNLKSKSTSILDEYSVTNKVLGLGINGKVVECYRKDTGLKYALKVLRDNPKARREVELHYQACDHPNIVKIIDVFENQFCNQKCILVVMECMEGGELFQAIQKRAESAFTEREAAQIISKICSAVQHLHNMYIAHRDLKPENLLFTSSDPKKAELKLTDFGFAKKSDPNTDTTRLLTSCFTPYYAAPEILSGTEYDKSCDLWSIGVITYILLCGYPPFYSTSGQAMSAGMKKRIRAAQFEFPEQEWKNVSEQAKDLIRNLLQVDPAKRMTIDQLSTHSWVSTNMEVPHTPLCTAKVLKKDEEKWNAVQEEMQSALAAMRVDTDVQLKQLHLSENGLLAKRKNRKQKLEITA